MKKLLVIVVISLIFFTGCGNSHGNYSLRCTGKHTMTTDVCFYKDFEATRDSNSKESTNKIELCGSISSGEGDYYFYLEDDKVYLEFEEKYNEDFTEKYYDDLYDALDDFKSNHMECSLDKKDKEAILKCKKHDVTNNFKDYNSKIELKDLMENKLEYKCN